MAVSPPAEPGAGWGRTHSHLQVVQTRVVTGKVLNGCFFREVVAVQHVKAPF